MTLENLKNRIIPFFSLSLLITEIENNTQSFEIQYFENKEIKSVIRITKLFSETNSELFQIETINHINGVIITDIITDCAELFGTIMNQQIEFNNLYGYTFL